MKREIPYDSSRIIITITASYPGAEDQSTTVTLLPNFSHTIQIDADNHVLSFNDGPKESVIKATCTSGMSPKLKCNLVGNDCFTFEDNKDGTGLLKMIKPVDDGIISVDIVATCHDAVAQSITIILTHDHVENPTVNVSASSYQLSSQNPTSIITA
ncbi:hypothetical protein FACS1894218_0610 [Bacilli bacterium]|nr:hypothetical protein FACS1894218_0610 [Bacilli bacterium]